MEVRRPAGLSSGPRPAGRRSPWALSRPALQGLLLSLDPDEERGARQYEVLRHKLIVFFSGRRCTDAEDRADDTLDRVSRRLEEGTEVVNVARFAYGVARLVLTESYKRDRRRRSALRLAGAAAAVVWAPFDGEGTLETLRACFARLPAADRELILGYYESVGREGQGERRALAARLGISPGALRLRAHRIRSVLEVAIGRSQRSAAARARTRSGRRR